MVSWVSSDLLLCIQLFINFAVLFYYVLVYILKDAAKYDLWYACSRCSYDLNICCIVIEGGFNNANGSSSLESLNPHNVWSRAGPWTHSLTYFSCHLAIGHVHICMTGTVTFIFSLICDNLLETWKLWCCFFSWDMGWGSNLRKHYERGMFETK